jgi:hypothetical protein
MAERNEILVESASPTLDTDLPLGAKLAAFLPITVALAGVIAVLIGGVSARPDATAEIPAIDSIATGSITSD